jgi:preprotein translocase subunit SecF
LVQLVGIIVGTYSSIFFATPLLVSLRERTELVRTHNRRVGRRRGPVAEKEPAEAPAKDEPDKPSAAVAAAGGNAPSNKPAPGARPARQGGGRHSRPTGKRNK